MSQRKTYFLDLQTLISYLSDQSCELTTIVKVSGKAARGSILLKEGEIVSCLLQFQDGSQIVGVSAYKLLLAGNQWQVELEQAEEKEKTSPLVAQPSTQPRYLAPLRQKRPLDPAFLQNLPMRERSIVHSVFAMVNGRRTSEEIKAQLHLSPRDIDEALARLRLLGLVE